LSYVGPRSTNYQLEIPTNYQLEPNPSDQVSPQLLTLHHLPGITNRETRVLRNLARFATFLSISRPLTRRIGMTFHDDPRRVLPVGQ